MSGNSVSNYVKSRRRPQPVVARRILKNGRLSVKSQAFSSIKDAAIWAVKQGLTDKVLNAEFNICAAAQGRDHNFNRVQAYGYVWNHA